MIVKRLLRPDRRRQIPPSFSWVDHRLVSAHFLDRCDPPSLALYLFLVTVADAQGLSYYSEASISRRLRLDPVQLAAARRQLEAAELIAYVKPLYQVLALEPSSSLESRPSGPPERAGQALSVGEILRRLSQGGGEA
jgi:hypothetical protein